MGSSYSWKQLSVAVAVAMVAMWGLRPPQVVAPETMLPSLAGQNALVTGASRGIGFGIASALVEAGASVSITGRKIASLQEACTKMKGPGDCVPLQVDSADDGALEELFSKFDRLDILVNNAFTFAGQVDPYVGLPFWEKGETAGHMFDAANQVGLRSHYVASVHGAKIMAKQTSGLIVQISSAGGLAYFFDVAYGLGKAAVDRMAADMQIELAAYNVTCVSVWPGLVETEEVVKRNRDKMGIGIN